MQAFTTMTEYHHQNICSYTFIKVYKTFQVYLQLKDFRQPTVNY